MALWRHSDNSVATNNYYMDFVQMRGLISLVNDNHMDNNLKEILVCILRLDCKNWPQKMKKTLSTPVRFEEHKYIYSKVLSMYLPVGSQ